MITPGVYICTGGGEFVCRIHMFYLRSAGGINLERALLTQVRRPALAGGADPADGVARTEVRVLAARRSERV